MNAAEVVARARSALNQGIPYVLGASYNPSSLAPPAAGLDCSRFAFWVLGHPANTMPRESSEIVNDALGAQAYFRPLGNAPRPGCVIVYPDYTARVMGKKLVHDGHVGIVTETAVEGGKTVARSIVHCSRVVEGVRAGIMPGSPPDSIAETGPVWFPAFAAIYVWYKPVAESP